MLVLRVQPESGILKYIILLASMLQWASDYLSKIFVFQRPEEEFKFETPNYVDDLPVTRYVNKNAAGWVECVVCLNRINEGDEVRELGCNHVYHRVCLDGWVRFGHRTCPLCRRNLMPPVAAELPPPLFEQHE